MNLLILSMKESFGLFQGISGQLKITGLNMSMKYDISFFASAAISGDVNVSYSVNGKTIMLNAAGNKSGMQLGRQCLGQLNNGGAPAGKYKHPIFDQLGRFLGNDPFLRIGIHLLGRMIAVMKRRGKSAAVNFDDLTRFRQFLKVTANGIIRNIDMLT